MSASMTSAASTATSTSATASSQRPLLIALDLDGTLLTSHGRLSQRNADAVKAVAAAGHHVVIATGRPLHLVSDLGDQLGDSIEYVVGTNGAMIGTFPDGELLQLLGFPFDTARATVESLRTAHPDIGFALATDRGLAHERGFAERMPAAVDTEPVPDVLALGGIEAYKLFAFHPELGVGELLDVVPPLLPDGLAANHMGAEAIDIGPANIDKCAGLKWVAERLAVDVADVIAFGDEWNDITMLEWAGRGIAMGNADARVKAAADEVAPANTNDGVAVVLEWLLD